MSDNNIHPYLPEADLVVLDTLFKDVDQQVSSAKTNDTQYSQTAIETLKNHNDPDSPYFRPTVFVSWDDKDIPESLNKYIIRPYARYATTVVRHPTDVVFLTHIILYFTINLPSAIILYNYFTYIHGIAHFAFTFWCVGSFTLMMHNHIHNNGILSKRWAWLDQTFPYLFEPLMGHTWDSYYYHHVKHHHVEGNGPDDLSSTVRYQRDDIFHFLHYVGRFLFLIWLDLPLYFIRKGKTQLAIRAAVSELASYAFMFCMTYYVNTRASIFVLIIPFITLRLGLMVGNWGQHALIDELEPDSDFRSSITLIDVPSNRFCFNDGYHTAHHLNPLRHWREQPVHFLQSKDAYREGRALVFHNIDYLMLTVKLMQKDYKHLANCLVPMGDQINMSKEEIAAMLQTKTRKFTEDDIRKKFENGAKMARKNPSGSWNWSKLLDTVQTASASFWKSTSSIQAVSMPQKSS
ncbi:hypothetical protein MRB53_038536 [Persea americana]|nr:hypothetical protein MRB53_038536 [Persea americana]